MKNSLLADGYMPLTHFHVYSDLTTTIGLINVRNENFLTLDHGFHKNAGYVPGVTRFQPPSSWESRVIDFKTDSAYLMAHKRIALQLLKGLPYFPHFPHILFHPVSTPKDSTGCIGLAGESVSWDGRGAKTVYAQAERKFIEFEHLLASISDKIIYHPIPIDWPFIPNCREYTTDFIVDRVRDYLEKKVKSSMSTITK
jgi:hypothetical protein